MSKIKYFMKANNKLSTTDASVFELIAKNNFINIKKIISSLSNDNDIHNSIKFLLSEKLIEQSENCYVVSGLGMDLVIESAMIFLEENPTKVRNTRKSRGVTEKMLEDVKTLTDLLVENAFQVKTIFENRSNLEIHLLKRVNGVRQFEIRHNNIMRIFGYKISEIQVKIYESIGASVKNKGVNYYIDIESSIENMIKMINVTIGKHYEL